MQEQRTFDPELEDLLSALDGLERTEEKTRRLREQMPEQCEPARE